jgi:hypothetical protein
MRPGGSERVRHGWEAISPPGMARERFDVKLVVNCEDVNKN